MDGRNYGLLEQLSCSMEHMTHLAELAENMVAVLKSGNITEDSEKMQDHIERLWALTAGIVELQRARERDIDKILSDIEVTTKEALE